LVIRRELGDQHGLSKVIQYRHGVGARPESMRSKRLCWLLGPSAPAGTGVLGGLDWISRSYRLGNSDPTTRTRRNPPALEHSRLLATTRSSADGRLNKPSVFHRSPAMLRMQRDRGDEGTGSTEEGPWRASLQSPRCGKRVGFTSKQELCCSMRCYADLQMQGEH
jgi:hypothetical protein